MADSNKIVALLQEALALLQGGKPSRKPRAGGKRGGNKALVKLDLQRKMVLKEMVAEWEKLPKAKREEKTTETHTTKSGKEVTREVYTHPQPNYKDAISECKKRKDAGQELPEVPEEEIEAAWAAQQEKAAASEASGTESSEEADADAEPEPEPTPKKKAGRPKKTETEAEAVVEEAKAAAANKKSVKKAGAAKA